MPTRLRSVGVTGARSFSYNQDDRDLLQFDASRICPLMVCLEKSTKLFGNDPHVCGGFHSDPRLPGFNYLGNGTWERSNC